MKLFYRTPRRNEVYQINGSMGAVRFVLGLCFWIWGICGSTLIFVQFSEMMANLNTSVGPSSFLAALALVWIGGMLFFGLGSLLAGSNFNVVQRATEDNCDDVKISR